jgi:hypothetical protein
VQKVGFRAFYYPTLGAVARQSGELMHPHDDQWAAYRISCEVAAIPYDPNRHAFDDMSALWGTANGRRKQRIRSSKFN